MPHPTQASIRRVDPTKASPAEVIAIIREEGGVVLQGFIAPESVQQINHELDEPLANMAPGSTHGAEHIRKFHGAQTKRMTNMVVRSKTFREQLFDHDYIHDLCRHTFHNETGSYWIMSTQLIEIGPGNVEQALHRDADQYQVFSKLGNDGPEAVLNFLCALTDCTKDNGATRVVPGSNKWPDWSVRATQDDTVSADLDAGDVLLINGRLMHGGGANRTQENRRVLSWSFIPSFLTPEEAYPLIVPMDLAKTLSPRGQRMLGFRSQFPMNSPGLWQSDYSELGDFLGLEGDDPDVEKVKMAGKR
ncbi:hypothetical protein LTR56_024654 [Elasticomyces elasticus]|nr:hypothetical protein LTR56_024654 [Elasticomyces elasticus]KAK3622220.1 hypothetical protein LTR22_024880 [Elasticomyces elasticus]KAK4919776.1 hypothetical protein LTR49_012679 [Elasticomyces elasticus]KAK5758402.1 hypothetical protein LTS12_011424 [Elasticomyces elasticus]